jgi:hypothetical protein
MKRASLSLSLDPGSAVDWNTPELDALLKKSDSWQIDSRSYNACQEVEIYIGWGTHRREPASVACEDDGTAIIETAASIASGQHVRVDKASGDKTHSQWAIVTGGRPGVREGDKRRNSHVYWLRFTQSLSPS